MNTEKIEKWLEDNDLSNNALKIGETHRVELYLSDVLLKFYEEQVKNNDLLHSVSHCSKGRLAEEFQKVYKGIVKEGYYGENWDALFIGENRQPIAEIFEEDFEAKQVTVRYWTSDEEKTKEEIQESVLRKLFGDVEANYNDAYSEITGYLWTYEDLNIGGHDLLEEIRSYLGKFIYLEVDVH